MSKFRLSFYLLIFISLFISVISLSTVLTKNFDLLFSISKLWYSNDVSLESEYLDKVSKYFNINRSFLNIDNSSFLIETRDPSYSLKLLKDKVRETDAIVNETEFSINEKLPKDSTLLVKGRDGGYIYNYTEYVVNSNDSKRSKKHLDSIEYLNPVNDLFITGSLSLSDFSDDITLRFNNEINNFKESGEYDNEIFENLENTSFVLNEKIKESYNLSEDVVIGNIKVDMGNCNRETSISIVFNPLSNSVGFNNFNGFVDTLCKRQFIEYQGYLIGTCTNCTLYPVGKGYSLNSEYSPKSISLTDFEGSYKEVSSEIFNDLKSMYLDALNSGVVMTFVSAYRSYLSQYYTYEYWISVEMSKGYSRSEAEVIANTYSAIPGFSEHQLGTTLDINGIGCGIGEYCSSNESVWNWLKDNAYKFGFVQSYKEGQDSGYIPEPWHYRWIGKELALEYKEVENKKTLQTFLYDLGRY